MSKARHGRLWAVIGSVAGCARGRREFLQRYEGTPVLILPAHFPTPTAGTIERRESAWRFRFIES
jgi:hypothetical protein